MKKADVKSFPMRDTVLSSLEAEEKEYRINDGNNLHFVVNPKGNKRWELRYKKPDGKWSWLGVGTYPELSGASARKKAKELINDISNGDNPIITKQARKQKDLEENNASFEVLAREWLDIKQNRWVPDTMVRNKGALEKHIFPILGKWLYTTKTALFRAVWIILMLLDDFMWKRSTGLNHLLIASYSDIKRWKQC